MTENYTLFKKKLLPCYWILIKSECLIMGHQVIVRLELPTKGSCQLVNLVGRLSVYSNNPSHDELTPSQ